MEGVVEITLERGVEIEGVGESREDFFLGGGVLTADVILVQ